MKFYRLLREDELKSGKLGNKSFYSNIKNCIMCNHLAPGKYDVYEYESKNSDEISESVIPIDFENSNVNYIGYIQFNYNWGNIDSRSVMMTYMRDGYIVVLANILDDPDILNSTPREINHFLDNMRRKNAAELGLPDLGTSEINFDEIFNHKED